MRDQRSLVACATISALGARGVTLEGGVRFSDEIIFANSTFTPWLGS